MKVIRCEVRDAIGETDVCVLPLISVICPVRNEGAFIENMLRQLLRQNYEPGRFEILVIDGDSTDATREIVLRMADTHPQLRLLDNPRRWSSAARNVGIRAARGEILVIVDGHCEIESDDYLTQLAMAFTRTDADCLGRPQPLDVPDPSPLQRAIALVRSSPLGHHPASYIYSAEETVVPAHSVAVAYRRGVFDQVGLFDESFDACEDVELNHRIDRAGLRCVLVPRLRICYHPRASLAKLARQMIRYGRGRVRLLRKHPETFSPLGFVPAAFLLGALSGWLSIFFSTGLAWLYAATLGVYVLTVLAASLALVKRSRQWPLLPLLPAVFATLHLAAGAGVLAEFLPGRDKTRVSSTLTIR